MNLIFLIKFAVFKRCNPHKFLKHYNKMTCIKKTNKLSNLLNFCALVSQK